jgi:hypothetical protein
MKRCFASIHKMQFHDTISTQFNVSAEVEIVLGKALGNKQKCAYSKLE